MSGARNRILVGDVRQRLAEVPGNSVDCVITSPPYYQLRDYGHAEQLGLEATVEQWADALAGVLREIGRVLKPTGAVWVNLGDSYSRHEKHGAPAKSLLLGPERLALKLLDEGWIVRNKIVWAKSNPMPSSVRDRLSSTSEVIYLLTRSGSYFFDLDAIRTPHRSTRGPRKESRFVPHVYPAPGAGAPAWGNPAQTGNRALAELNDRGEGRSPTRQEPRRRMADWHCQLQRRALRHLPDHADRAAATRNLPREGLRWLRWALAARADAAPWAARRPRRTSPGLQLRPRLEPRARARPLPR